jgi:hypothetical protein
MDCLREESKKLEDLRSDSGKRHGLIGIGDERVRGPMNSEKIMDKS